MKCTTARILDALRKREPITHDMVCDDIDTLEELDGYRKGLSARGLLTTDAMRAIQAKQDALHGVKW